MCQQQTVLGQVINQEVSANGAITTLASTSDVAVSPPEYGF